MYSRLQVVMIASTLLLAVFLLAAWNGMQRQQAFEENAFTVGRATLSAAASEIEVMVRNLQDRIQLFAREHQGLIQQLAHSPDDEAAREQLSKRLKDYFPYYFAFTISDDKGRPLLEDIESLVGEACKQDLQHYSELVVTRGAAYRNSPVLHPLPNNYHFDVMAPWRDHNGHMPSRGVFFVSFHPGLLSEALRRHTLPGYQLILVQQRDPALIEASARGSRDQLKRDIRLSKDEQKRILLSRSVETSGWKLVLLPDKGLMAETKRQIWSQVALVVAAILALAIVLLLAAARMQARKNSSQAAGRERGRSEGKPD